MFSCVASEDQRSHLHLIYDLELRRISSRRGKGLPEYEGSSSLCDETSQPFSRWSESTSSNGKPTL